MLYANNRDIDITYMLYILFAINRMLTIKNQRKRRGKTKQKTNQNKNKQTKQSKAAQSSISLQNINLKTSADI
jgi:hypothetical protein